MGLVVRYFSTTGDGTEDGTSWANRAPLISSGVWNTIITAFPFTAGSDALECRVGPGTYSCPGLNTSIFSAGTPVRTKPLYFTAVQFSAKTGAELLLPPNPNWSSAQPIWDTTGMPIFDFGSNRQNLAHVLFHMMRLHGSAAAGVIALSGRFPGGFTWCEILSTGTSTGGIVAGGEAANTVIRCTSANYADIFLPVGNTICHNVRVEGNSSAVGGARRGFRSSSNGGQFYTQCTSIDNAGDGYLHDVNATSPVSRLYKCISYNNGTGFRTSNSTTLTTSLQQQISQCVIVNSSAYGVDLAQSPVIISDTRFRNNTSGNYTATSVGQGLVLTTDESAGSDADEFVDAAGKDFRIKNTSVLWGKGYGPADEPPNTTVAYFG